MTDRDSKPPESSKDEAPKVESHGGPREFAEISPEDIESLFETNFETLTESHAAATEQSHQTFESALAAGADLLPDDVTDGFTAEFSAAEEEENAVIAQLESDAQRVLAEAEKIATEETGDTVVTVTQQERPAGASERKETSLEQRMLGREWMRLGRERPGPYVADIRAAELLAQDEKGVERLLVAMPGLETGRDRLLDIVGRAAEEATDGGHDIVKRLAADETLGLTDEERSSLEQRVIDHGSWRTMEMRLNETTKERAFSRLKDLRDTVAGLQGQIAEINRRFREEQLTDEEKRNLTQEAQDSFDEISFMTPELERTQEEYLNSVRDMAQVYLQRPDRMNEIVDDPNLDTQGRKVLAKELLAFRRLDSSGEHAEFFDEMFDRLKDLAQEQPERVPAILHSFPLSADQANGILLAIEGHPERDRLMKEARLGNSDLRMFADQAEIDAAVETVEGLPEGGAEGRAERVAELGRKLDEARDVLAAAITAAEQAARPLQPSGQLPDDWIYMTQFRDGYPTAFGNEGGDALKGGDLLKAAGHLTGIVGTYLDNPDWRLIGRSADALRDAGLDQEADDLLAAEEAYKQMVKEIRREADRLLIEGLPELNRSESELDAEILRLHPEDAARLDRYTEVRSGLSGTVTEVQKLGGDNAVTAPRRVFLEGRPVGGIAKDPSTEVRSPINPQTLSYGYSLRREAEAGILSKATGLYTAPVSTIRTMPEGLQFVQEWVPSETQDDKEWLARMNRDPQFKLDVLAANLPKMLMNDKDGHDGQFVESSDGKIKSIDAGLSRMNDAADLAEAPDNVRRIYALWSWGGKMPPPEMQTVLKRTIEMYGRPSDDPKKDVPPNPAVLKHYQNLYGPEEGARFVRETAERAADYLENGFPPFQFSPNHGTAEKDIAAFEAAGGRRHELSGEIDREAYVRVNWPQGPDAQGKSDAEKRQMALDALEALTAGTKIDIV